MARVLIIASLASSLLRFRGDLIAELRALGHEVLTCAPPADPATAAGLHRAGVGSITVRLQRTSLNPLNDLRYLCDLHNAIVSSKPEILLAYTPKPVIYSGIACRSLRVVRHFPLISGLGYGFGREGLLQRSLTPVVRRLYRHALSRSECVIFQNPDDRKLFISQRIVASDRTALVNGSGVDLERFAVQPLPSVPSFLLMARLIPEKGIREYVAAARALRRQLPGARFLLAGWLEPRRGAISAEELDAWRREGVVEYLGALDDVRAAIAAAGIYVLPSYYGEGIPRSVLEALAMGRAIVTTHMPGCRETVTDGENGYLVRPRDSQMLADAMLRLAANPRLVEQMGAASRRLAEEKFAVRRVNAQMLSAMGLAA